MEAILLQKQLKARQSTVHGFMPHELMSFALPARRTSEKSWTRRNGDYQYTVTAGSARGTIELPSGKYARAALLYLCTQAKLTRDPKLHLTESYRGYISSLGMTWQGNTSKEAMRQLTLVSVATFHIDYVGEERAADEEHTKSQGARFSEDADIWTLRGELSTAKESYVVLSPLFMKMMERAVPIRLENWRWLLRSTNSAMALDVYLWLCSRLYRCDGHSRVTWAQLYDQFGSTAPLKRFKQHFREALETALEVYPEARIREDFGTSRTKGFKGFHLHPSPDPRDSKTPDEVQAALSPAER